MIKPHVLLFLDFGGGEIIIIFLVILIVLGPDKIPAFAKKAGEVIRFVRKATDDIKTEINKEANAVQEPFKEAYGEVSAFSRNASDAVKDTLKDIENIDKTTNTEDNKNDTVSLEDIDKAKDVKTEKTDVDNT